MRPMAPTWLIPHTLGMPVRHLLALRAPTTDASSMRRWSAQPLAARLGPGWPLGVGAHSIFSWRRQGANATNTAP
jgi:hypothetical protein